jgi:multidrug efflux pump
MITVNLNANTDLRTKEEFEELVVKETSGVLVRLKDVASVVLGAEDYDQDVQFNGQKATFMGIWVLPTANPLDVINEVRRVLPLIEKAFPAGLKLGIPYDSTRYIADSINEVINTLLETILIVILVIYLFIGSFRAVLVPVIAIPLSLIGAFVFMSAFGFSVNLLTLLAIVLAVGLVVDDAIVMLENVERYVNEEGLSPFDAAIRGARELVGPIIAMTITLVAVYAPIGFQGGLTGALFREFAFTLAGAVFISGFVALTLSPMMSSKLLKNHEEPNFFQQKLNFFFDALKNSYGVLLARTLGWRAVMATFAAIMIVLAVPFYLFSGKELAPREDQGVIFGIVQAAPNNSIEQTVRFADELGKIFRSLPEYAANFQLTFPGNGFSGVVLKPWSERVRSSDQIEPELWMNVGGLAGIQPIITSPAPLPGGSDFPVEMVISSTAEPIQIFEFANRLVGEAFASGFFMFADSDLKYDQPQSEVVIDRDKVAAMGINLQDVGINLGVMLSGNYVNRFNVQGRSYKVIPQVSRDLRLNPEQLQDYQINIGAGRLVPVSTFATVKNVVEPRSLNRFQQLNSAKIQGVPRPGATIDQALSAIESKAREILPADYTIDFAGESRQLRKEGSALLLTFSLALILIFLVLAGQFESFRDPFIILLGSVPLAISGALIFTFLDATTINIYTQVGLITLVGLVSKNGILIVEFANKLQEKGYSKIEAVREASLTRLRPILMTSVATVVGHFPLVIASGAGSGARNSIGIVLVSGMTIGTLFTLFVVPSIYLYIAKDRSGRMNISHSPESIS